MISDKHKVKVITCIYSSHEDYDWALKLRDEIKESIFHQKILIVLTDNEMKENYRLDKDHLYLKVKECYTYLAKKTQAMFKALDELFVYDYICKWDAGTADHKRCKQKWEKSNHCLYEFETILQNKKIDEYAGHLSNRIGPYENAQWMKQKGVFPIIKSEGRDRYAKFEKVWYKVGKMYICGSNFIKFLVSEEACEHWFDHMHQHGFGSEDIAVGLCYREYVNAKSQI